MTDMVHIHVRHTFEFTKALHKDKERVRKYIQAARRELRALATELGYKADVVEVLPIRNGLEQTEAWIAEPPHDDVFLDSEDVDAALDRAFREARGIEMVS